MLTILKRSTFQPLSWLTIAYFTLCAEIQALHDQYPDFTVPVDATADDAENVSDSYVSICPTSLKSTLRFSYTRVDS